MPTLPSRPNLGYLRKQAKDLVRWHRDRSRPPVPDFGGTEINRYFPGLLTSGDPLTLSQGQLILAREYGFASWPRLTAAVQAIHAGSWQGPTESDQDTLQAFMDSLFAGNWQQADSLFEKTPSLLRAPFEWQGFSPLFHAIDRGLEEAADWLRDRGAFLDAWEASRLGDLEALIALHGQDPILLQGRREHWWATPLHAATTPECAAFLLEQGAEVNAIDGPKQCITPLHLAVEHGLALTEVLLAHGADANAVSPVMGQPLHTAVSGYQHRAPEQWQHCAALLLQHGADLEGSYNADNPGWTPLLDAVKKPHLAAARFLIEQGANVHVQDQYGQSVRHFAEKRCPELVPTLNERGA